MLCKHKWELLSETVTESVFEHSMKIAKVSTTQINLPGQLCDGERKHIQVFVCGKCGKLKRFVETI